MTDNRPHTKILTVPQISLTDPDSRSMATSGRGSGVVGYNVQVAVDIKHHLIITHEVTNVGSDRAQLAHMAKSTKGNFGINGTVRNLVCEVMMMGSEGASHGDREGLA